MIIHKNSKTSRSKGHASESLALEHGLFRRKVFDLGILEEQVEGARAQRHRLAQNDRVADAVHLVELAVIGRLEEVVGRALEAGEHHHTLFEFGEARRGHAVDVALSVGLIESCLRRW